ncbi:MAG: LytTR family DNA-binding domain-containing protein [Bacteroidota bacterium]
MNCLMLDDEPLSLKILESYAAKMPQLRMLGFLTDPQQAYRVIEQEQVDLLFLDIQMPDISGLAFFASLSYQPMVIFSTAFRQYAVEGFELEAIDYLVKPYEFDRFAKAVQKASAYYAFKQGNQIAKTDAIFIRSTYNIVKIQLSDLYLVETADDYLKLHLHSQKRPIYTLMTLKEMDQRLPSDQFMRVHRSFIVAKQSITQIGRKKLIAKHTEIPVGVTYLKAFRDWFYSTS